MRHLKYIIFCFLSAGLTAITNAQDYVDLAKFHYAITPRNDFDSINGSTTIREFGADITLPIKLNEQHTILTGLYLEKIQTRLHPLSEKIAVSTINLKMGYHRKHNKKWSGTYLLLPKISSDLENLSSNDFQLGGLVLMKYASTTLKYNFGVYYNKELFGSFFVPLIGFYYQNKNKKLEINATLPIWADINYQLKSWLTMGTNFTAFVRSYALANDTYVVKRTNEIFGYLQFHVKKNFLIQTKAGYSIGRSYQSYNNDDKVNVGVSAFRFGDDRTVLNPIFTDGLVFKIRLLYRFYIQ